MFVLRKKETPSYSPYTACILGTQSNVVKLVLKAASVTPSGTVQGSRLVFALCCCW